MLHMVQIQTTELPFSIFPRTEEFLVICKQQRIIKALKLRNEWIEQYRNFVDFLFCEIFPFWQRACFAFYRRPKNGIPLQNILTKKQVDIYDGLLVDILKCQCIPDNES